jgi:hypothetical protein
MTGDTNGVMTSRWTPEQWIQLFKEIVTAGIGLAIIGYTLYMVGATFSMVGDAQRLPGAKDLLLLLLSLAGVVIGYYFGRVPADARSAQAQQQAMDAAARTMQVGAQAEKMSQMVGMTMDQIRTASSFTKDDAMKELEDIDRQLRELSDMTRTH